jgi:Zn-dependent protease with chaperone function
MRDTTLDDAFATLPVWARILPLLVLPAATYALTRLAAATARVCAPRRPPPEAHWTVTARWAGALRLDRGSACLFAFLLAAALGFASAPTAAYGGETARALLTVVAFAAAANAASRATERAIHGGVAAFDDGLPARAAFVVVFRLPLLVVGLSAAANVERTFDAVAVVVAAVFAAIPFALGRSGPSKMLRPVGALGPAPERLRTVAALAAADLGVPAPAVGTVRLPFANALADPAMRTVYVVPRTLDLLDDDGLRALLRHELAHFAQGAALRRHAAVAVATLAACSLLFPIYRSCGGVACLATLVAIFGALLLANRLLRAEKLERAADAVAHADGTDGRAYARALETLYRAALLPARMRRVDAPQHPDLYDRLLAAGVVPNFPSPPPPPRYVRTGAATIAVLAAAGFGAWRAGDLLADRARTGRDAAALSLAVRGARAAEFGDLGIAAIADNRPVDALKLFRAELALRPWSPDAAAHVVHATARLADVVATEDAAAEFRRLREAYWATYPRRRHFDEVEDARLKHLAKDVDVLLENARRRAESR